MTTADRPKYGHGHNTSVRRRNLSLGYVLTLWVHVAEAFSPAILPSFAANIVIPSTKWHQLLDPLGYPLEPHW